jgi:hypothetical protein
MVSKYCCQYCDNGTVPRQVTVTLDNMDLSDCHDYVVGQPCGGSGGYDSSKLTNATGQLDDSYTLDHKAGVGGCECGWEGTFSLDTNIVQKRYTDIACADDECTFDTYPQIKVELCLGSFPLGTNRLIVYGVGSVSNMELIYWYWDCESPREDCVCTNLTDLTTVSVWGDGDLASVVEVF